MRVIAGSAKGRQLKVPKPTTTRPMTDLVKGALFSMLLPLGLAERRVLDLFAGSGSLGIEALSRGAATADFVEQNAAVCAIIAANLAHTGFDDRARIHRARVEAFLVRLAATPPPEPFDLVFMDPPYALPDIPALMATLASSATLAPDVILVVGHSVRVPLPDAAGHLPRRHARCHGDSCFSIYVAPAAAAGSPPDRRGES